jgi:hypothetical protein
MSAGHPQDPASTPGPAEGEADGSTTCAGCGAVVADRPPTWSFQRSRSGPQWLCATCTRDNVRSIEGRLDEAWW